MRIRKFKTKYHKYIFEFDYAPFIVKQIKEIQSHLPNTWQDLAFNKTEEGKEGTGWVFSSLEAFKALCDEFEPFVEDSVNEEMEKILEKKEQQESREEKMDTVDLTDLAPDIQIPTLKPLFPFQRVCVQFVEKIGGKALIADDMGCGKTIEAIGYGCYKNYGRVLVICPASVKENWKREIKTFSGVDANILTDTEKRGGWEIIGYPNLNKHWDYIRKEDYQLIIIDEAHYIKNKKAIRTKKVLTLIKTAKDVLFLTGTPVLNRPHEIYNIFNAIRPMPFWGNNGFATRYCGLMQDPYGRWDFTGATNLDELKQKMSFMIKRTKKEVLEQLPDKTINVIETELKDWADYKQILTDYKKWLADKNLNEAAALTEALTKVNYLKQVTVQNKDVEGVIDDFLENGKKMIVFSQYRKVIDRLYQKYAHMAVSLTGQTPTNERQELIDIFQTNNNIRIFFSTIKAGGVGITLTQADTVVFTDLDWTPASHQQAEDRAYRIGQKNNVNVYYLIAPDTIEEKIWKMLKRKQAMIDKIMEGETARKVHIKTLLKNL